MTGPTRSARSDLQVLGSAGYSVWLTAAGTGNSHWNGLALSRWRPDGQAAEQGAYVYVRDVATGRFWSATAAPCGGSVECWRDEAMVRFARRDAAITTTLEVAVDPEHAVEVRGVGLRNAGSRKHELELTSYLELALNTPRADDAHPAYSKMFVQTALEGGVLLAWRRKKDAAEPDVWIAQTLVVEGAEAGSREQETDRARFIGRDGSLAAPAALESGHPLSGTAGTVLDPVFSLRTRIQVAPKQTRRLAFVTAAAASREAVLALIRGYRTPAACAGVFARARAAAQAQAAPGVGTGAARTFQVFAGALAGSDHGWRADAAARAEGEGGAPVLWAKGISGDLPIVLVRVADAAQTRLVAALLQAQAFWRARQLPADVVVLDAGDEATHAALADLSGAAQAGGQSQGSVFVLRAGQIDARLRAGLHTAACIVLDAGAGGLAAQIRRHAQDASTRAGTPVARSRQALRGGEPIGVPVPASLEYWNGLGGFGADGREYVTVLRDGMHTPAPWSHIVANPGFGFLVTATGGGYAWAGNSQQNQLTRWSNDAVCDPAGESFLLRDCADGSEWSATATPVRARGAAYVARFGAGYARFDACVQGIDTQLTQCVAGADAVKLSRLRVHNSSGRRRRLQVAQVVDWLLGPIGSDPRATTQASADTARRACFARNAWRDEFAQATAFVACGTPGAVPGNDGNARSAVVATLELAPAASADIVFLLGEGADQATAEALAAHYQGVGFDRVLDATAQAWEQTFAPLQVTTPVRSIDLLVNRWLPYQVLACRLWARTAFYQASGAFGFRDQLQDVGALCLTRPDLARAHILLSASRQFEAGDAQHWWLPPSGKGVRTRIVDDRLWLPYIVAHYVATTGDAAILDEQVPFLRADALQPGQTDAFFAPATATAGGALFEHCARAIEVSLATGAHGLPLMGTGDWNDGMNRVGAGGRGESVWMGWFLITVINGFAPLAADRADARTERWRDHARALQLALETKAWDGGWYRRAFYDDGTPLGTAADTECRIESMAQSWAVISGAADRERARRAMDAVGENLVRRNDGLVALFSAPFDQTPHDPGYIKGYPPGLRENGGQYTHGSIWSLIAFALLGDGERVGDLLEIFDPVRKAATPAQAARYKVEPYVQCADVYAVEPHTGRGGWTWYSGSAGWFYRAIVEWVLGLKLQGDRLCIVPCIPRNWPEFSIRCQRGTTAYEVTVENPHGACGGVAAIELDGVTLQGSRAGVALVDDGATHHVRMTLQKEPS